MTRSALRPGWQRLRLAVLTALLLASCLPSDRAAPDEPYLTGVQALLPADLDPDRPLRLLASTTILADVVAQVAGETAVVESIIPLGVDPHAFEPTPQDVKRLLEADVVFVHGLGLETFLADMLSAAGSQVPSVSVSTGVIPIEVSHTDEAVDHEHGPADPHTWLNPQNVIAATRVIEQALSRLDPADVEIYHRNADGYRQQLQALDADLERQLAVIPPERRKLVTDHEDLAYFAQRYDFTIIGTVLPGSSSLADPSAQDIARLIDTLRQEAVPAVFVTAVVNPAFVERIAREGGARVVTLYTHSLTAEDGPAPDYLTLMRYNGEAVVRALAP
jgi:ABC-type Zn uptake system ZnuABC Zn-binding protein ZnuA